MKLISSKNFDSNINHSNIRILIDKFYIKNHFNAINSDNILNRTLKQYNLYYWDEGEGIFNDKFYKLTKNQLKEIYIKLKLYVY